MFANSGHSVNTTRISAPSIAFNKLDIVFANEKEEGETDLIGTVWQLVKNGSQSRSFGTGQVVYFLSSDAYHTLRSRKFQTWDAFSTVDGRNLVRLKKNDGIEIVNSRPAISPSRVVTLTFRVAFSVVRLLRLDTSFCRLDSLFCSIGIDDVRLEIVALISLISNVVDAWLADTLSVNVEKFNSRVLSKVVNPATNSFKAAFDILENSSSSAALNELVDGLTTSLNTLELSLSTLTDNVSANQASTTLDISEISNTISSLSSSITTLETEVSNLSGLPTENATLKERVTSLLLEITTLESTIRGIYASLQGGGR